MNFREERNYMGAWLSVTLGPQEPIIQPSMLRAGWGSLLNLKLSFLSKHGCHLSVSLMLKRSTWGFCSSWVICFQWLQPTRLCCNWQLTVLTSPEWVIKFVFRWFLKLIWWLYWKTRAVGGMRGFQRFIWQNYSCDISLLSINTHHRGSRRTRTGSSWGYLRSFLKKKCNLRNKKFPWSEIIGKINALVNSTFAKTLLLFYLI